jgi:hypothetical protein
MAALTTLGGKKPKPLHYKSYQVVPEDQLDVPGIAAQGLQGLEGLNPSQAEAEQQLLSSVDSMLAGKAGAPSPAAAGSVAAPLVSGSSSSSSNTSKQVQNGVVISQKRQEGQQEHFASVKQQGSVNTLDVRGLIPEAAVDEVLDVIAEHNHLAAAAAASTVHTPAAVSAAGSEGASQQQQQQQQQVMPAVPRWGLQEGGGSGLLQEGVLYVDHGVGTGAVKRAVLRCLERQQQAAAVRKIKEVAPGITVVWLHVVTGS